MKTKICTKCGTEKFLFEFSKDKKTNNGFCCGCKDCSSLKSPRIIKKNQLFNKNLQPLWAEDNFKKGSK